MNYLHYPVSPYYVELPRKDLRQMIRAVRLLHKTQRKQRLSITHQALSTGKCTNKSRSLFRDDGL